jgi:hypothetical protein
MLKLMNQLNKFLHELVLFLLTNLIPSREYDSGFLLVSGDDSDNEQNDSSNENSNIENNTPNNIEDQNNNLLDNEDEGYTSDPSEAEWVEESVELDTPVDEIPIRHLPRSIREADKMARSLRADAKSAEDIQEAEFYESRIKEMKDIYTEAENEGEAPSPTAMSSSDISDSEENTGNSNSINNSPTNTNNSNPNSSNQSKLDSNLLDPNSEKKTLLENNKLKNQDENYSDFFKEDLNVH